MNIFHARQENIPDQERNLRLRIISKQHRRQFLFYKETFHRRKFLTYPGSHIVHVYWGSVGGGGGGWRKWPEL